MPSSSGWSDNEDDLSFINDGDFHVGAFRQSGAYHAFRRGGRYSRRDIPELIDDAAADFVFSTNLKSADNPYTVPFHFTPDELFHDRISVLVGRNGVGKTQLLKSIIDGLHDRQEQDQSRPHFLPAIRPNRVLVFSSVPTDPYPRSIGAWRGIDYEYVAVNATRESGPDRLVDALMACKRSHDEKQFGPDAKLSRFDVIAAALLKIGLWRRLHLPLQARGDEDEIPHVLNVDGDPYFPVAARLKERDLLTLTRRVNWRKAAVVLDDKMQPRALSSGEYAMLRFACQATAAIEQGSLLLLDEPETHLHPNYVSDLMEILDDLLQATKSVAIIATHSAYVVREAPRRRVNILDLDNREMRVSEPRMQTFGANIDAISQFIFSDTNQSHRFQKRWKIGQIGSVARRALRK